MVYRKHVSRTEATTEQTDDRCEGNPPSRGTPEEAEDNQHTSKHRSHIPALGSCSDTEEGKKGENVWHHNDKVGYCKAEHRGKVLPECCISGTVATNLRDWVLEKDVDTDNYDKNSANNAQNMCVLLNLSLHNGEEEVGYDSHQRIGTCHTQTGHNSGTSSLAQGALYAQHSHRSYRDRSRQTNCKTAQ